MAEELPHVGEIDMFQDSGSSCSDDGEISEKSVEDHKEELDMAGRTMLSPVVSSLEHSEEDSEEIVEALSYLTRADPPSNIQKCTVVQENLPSRSENQDVTGHVKEARVAELALREEALQDAAVPGQSLAAEVKLPEEVQDCGDERRHSLEFVSSEASLESERDLEPQLQDIHGTDRDEALVDDGKLALQSASIETLSRPDLERPMQPQLQDASEIEGSQHCGDERKGVLQPASIQLLPEPVRPIQPRLQDAQTERFPFRHFDKCSQDILETTEILEAIFGHSPTLPVFTSEGLTTDAVAKLRSSLLENHQDFDAWLNLVNSVEQEGKAVEIEAVYVEFLKIFPLCWGYWKRLANIRSLEYGSASAFATYEVAVAVAGSCVDLWIHYCEAVSSCDDDSRARSVFERAVNMVGHDWNSGPLWQQYLEFEQSRKQWPLFGAVLRRALSVPCAAIHDIGTRLNALMSVEDGPTPSQLCSHNEELELAKLFPAAQVQPTNAKSLPPQSIGMVEVVSSIATVSLKVSLPARQQNDEDLEEGELLDDSDAEQIQAESKPEVRSEPQLPGEHEEGELSDGLEEGEIIEEETQAMDGPEDVLKKVDDPIDKMWQWLLECRRSQYADTLTQVDTIWEFESQLKRAYFLNKPLNLMELDFWRRYLNFEESRALEDTSRLRLLYKRCLVTTNNYLEFWLRYVAFCEQTNSLEDAYNVIADACLSGRLQKRDDAIVLWAELAEKCGNKLHARTVLDAALATFGKSKIELMIRRVALERRAGNLDQCERLLAGYVREATTMASLCFLTRRYAQFCEFEIRNFESARRAFQDAWNKGCRDLSLLKDFTSFNMRCSRPERICRASLQNNFGVDAMLVSMTLFEEAIDAAATNYTLDEAAAVCQSYCEFLAIHGAPIQKVHRVEARSRVYFAAQRASGSTRNNVKKSLKRRFDEDEDHCKAAEMNEAAPEALSLGDNVDAMESQRVPEDVLLSHTPDSNALIAAHALPPDSPSGQEMQEREDAKEDGEIASDRPQNINKHSRLNEDGERSPVLSPAREVRKCTNLKEEGETAADLLLAQPTQKHEALMEDAEMAPDEPQKIYKHVKQKEDREIGSDLPSAPETQKRIKLKGDEQMAANLQVDQHTQKHEDSRKVGQKASVLRLAQQAQEHDDSMEDGEIDSDADLRIMAQDMQRYNDRKEDAEIASDLNLAQKMKDREATARTSSCVLRSESSTSYVREEIDAIDVRQGIDAIASILPPSAEVQKDSDRVCCNRNLQLTQQPQKYGDFIEDGEIDSDANLPIMAHGMQKYNDRKEDVEIASDLNLAQRMKDREATARISTCVLGSESSTSYVREEIDAIASVLPPASKVQKGNDRVCCNQNLQLTHQPQNYEDSIEDGEIDSDRENPKGNAELESDVIIERNIEKFEITASPNEVVLTDSASSQDHAKKTLKRPFCDDANETRWKTAKMKNHVSEAPCPRDEEPTSNEDRDDMDLRPEPQLPQAMQKLDFHTKEVEIEQGLFPGEAFNLASGFPLASEMQTYSDQEENGGKASKLPPPLSEMQKREDREEDGKIASNSNLAALQKLQRQVEPKEDGELSDGEVSLDAVIGGA